MGSLSVQTNTDDFSEDMCFEVVRPKRPKFFACGTCNRYFTTRAMQVHKRTCLETEDCRCFACRCDSKRRKFDNLVNIEAIAFENNVKRRDPEKRKIKVTPKMREHIKDNNVDHGNLLSFKLLEENDFDTNENYASEARKSTSPSSETSENSDVQAIESFCEVKIKVDHECDRKLFCCFCDQHFFWELFGSHIIEHCHTIQNNFLKCPNEDCDRSFSQPALFLTHYLIHNSNHPLECSDCKCNDPTCGKSNSTKNDHCDADTDLFHCYICLASFNHPQTVINHMRLHSKERPFKCTECNRSFRQVGNLQRHITTHRGDRPYNCPECSKSFADPATLRNHERVHTKETPYKCFVCFRSFTQVGNLKRHLTLHMKKQQSSISLSSTVRSNSSETSSSGVKVDTPNPVESDYIINDVESLCDISTKNRKKKGKMKVFTCKICKKVYAWKHDLVVHFRTHTGEKPYKCDVCSKKFAQSGAVRIHKARHHGESNDGNTKHKR